MRHRSDGNAPVGNRKKTAGSSPRHAKNGHWLSQFATPRNGSERCSFTAASTQFWAGSAIANDAAMARNTQPTTFPVRDAISAPTTAKAAPPSNPGTMSAVSSALKIASTTTLIANDNRHQRDADRRDRPRRDRPPTGLGRRVVPLSRDLHDRIFLLRGATREGCRPTCRRSGTSPAAGCWHPRSFRMLAGSCLERHAPTVKPRNRQGGPS